MSLRLIVIVGAIAIVGVVVAKKLFHTRSVAAVCHVWDTDGLALHNQFAQTGNNAASDPGDALGSLIGAPGEVGNLMSKMAGVAPSDVAPDFQALAEAMKQVSDGEGSDIGDPLAAIGTDLVAGFSTQQASQTVDTFLARYCGIPS
jgi:hypothetical protein